MKADVSNKHDNKKSWIFVSLSSDSSKSLTPHKENFQAMICYHSPTLSTFSV